MALLTALYAITLDGTCQGSRTQNTFQYFDPTGGTPATLSALLAAAAAFEALVVPAFVTSCSNDAEWFNIRVQDKAQAVPGTPIDYAIAATGSIMNSALPASTAFVMKRTGYLSIKAERGRIYIAGAPDSELNTTNGKWNGAYLATVNTAFQVLTSQLSVLGANCDPVLWNGGLGAPHPIVIARANTIPRNQRRRQPDRGL